MRKVIITLGDIVVDILVKSNESLRYGSDVTGDVIIRGGGSAANFASWLSYLSEEVSFIGKVGNDIFGSFLIDDLTSRGIKTHITKDSNVSTGKIILLVDKMAERSMITDRGANLLLNEQDIPKKLFSEAIHFHLTGYSFFGSSELLNTTKLAIRLAKKNSLSMSIDPSSYGLLKEFSPERFFKITDGFDIIFPNLDEGFILTGYRAPERIVKDLINYYPIVVLKMGKKGCMILRRGENLIRIDSNIDSSKEVLDTTGAGDSFAAAFIKSFLEDNDLKKAGNFANKIAYHAIKNIGGRPPNDKYQKNYH